MPMNKRCGAKYSLLYGCRQMGDTVSGLYSARVAFADLVSDDQSAKSLSENESQTN